jgi:hypothetical protein
MRYILIILVFLSIGADAQMVIKAHPNYVPFGAFRGLLDDYPNAAAAYSLRKLDKDYTGAAIRVRKDTTGQPEQDVFFTAAGDLDTAALKSFLNARSGFVTMWYDQSGSNNLTQTTSTRQPRIANLGVIDRQNGEPCVFYDGNDNLFTSSDITHTSFTIFANIYLRNAATTANSQGRLYRSEGTSNVFEIGGNVTASFTNERLVFYNAESGVKGYAYVDADIAIGTHLFTIDYTYLNTVDIRRNATSLTLQNVPFTASFYPKSFRNLGGGTTTTNGTLIGNVFEFILYTTSQTSNISGIQTNINNYYGIY